MQNKNVTADDVVNTMVSRYRNGIMLNMSSGQVADAIGVSASLMSEIEKGTRNATQATILRLAEVLECDPDSLRRRRLGPVQRPVQDMAQSAAALWTP